MDGMRLDDRAPQVFPRTPAGKTFALHPFPHLAAAKSESIWSVTLAGKTCTALLHPSVAELPRKAETGAGRGGEEEVAALQQKLCWGVESGNQGAHRVDVLLVRDKPERWLPVVNVLETGLKLLRGGVTPVPPQIPSRFDILSR